MKVFVSFSGGKESVYALYHGKRMGLDPRVLLTMLNTKGTRTRGHGLRRKFIEAQAEAIGLPLVSGRASWSTYEEVFKGILRRLKGQGIEGGIFGDLYLEEHRQWVERVCSEVGMKAFLPLWGVPPEEVYKGFIGEGFQARIVALRDGLLPKDLLGRILDLELLQIFSQAGVDPCGEKGEYHTVVLDGPIFKKKVEVISANIRKTKDIWILDVEAFNLSPKERP